MSAATAPAPPWHTKSAWRDINAIIVGGLDMHPCLSEARAQASTLRRELEMLFPIMENLCAGTCHWCPAPCCVSAKVWYDIKDLLFLHLAGISPPPEQPIHSFQATCRYLGIKGCKLPRLERPWICTWYLCPTLTARLKNMPPPLHTAFSETVQRIKDIRRDLKRLIPLPLRSERQPRIGGQSVQQSRPHGG